MDLEIWSRAAGEGKVVGVWRGAGGLPVWREEDDEDTMDAAQQLRPATRLRWCAS